MMIRTKVLSGIGGIALIVGGAAVAMDQGRTPQHAAPASPDGNLVVSLCDGETAVEAPGVKPGEELTRAQAQQVSDPLMEETQFTHPSMTQFFNDSIKFFCSLLQETKSPWRPQGFDRAGDRFRTGDLVLGKHAL